MNKLKKVRESRGLSQAQLAEKSGINIRTLQYYEQGVLDFNHCKIEKIFATALALDCDIEEILDNEETVALIREYQEG
jgi:transcriptional regulator with XRE-family HTH domain